MTKIFVDGSAGTTGLRIFERLEHRSGIELLRLPEELRKDPGARADAINQSDVAFFCLPDAAAIEAADLCTSDHTVIIDTSTAHRTNDDWTYGFPEIGGLRAKIRNSHRIANPGCHASGFIALAAPLTELGLLKKDARLSAFSLTGYSGGGKKMIAQYEEEGRDKLLDAPRQYGLTQVHKHLPEMGKLCGLTYAPAFCPIVAPYYSGMEVTIPVFAGDLTGTIEDVREAYRNYYKEGLVHYIEETDEGGMLSAGAYSGRDDMQITVCGNEDRILLVSRFDNLGKGASGAAIQNMNLVLGLPEGTGLVID